MSYILKRPVYIRNVFDRDMDVCTCGHVRRSHAADADFDGERYIGYSLECSGEYENGVKCTCEEFKDKDYSE